MRILTIAVLAGSAVLAANPLDQNKENDSGVNAAADALVVANDTVDPIVTGQTLSKEDISEWEADRKRYLECPECEAKQAFPGD